MRYNRTNLKYGYVRPFIIALVKKKNDFVFEVLLQ